MSRQFRGRTEACAACRPSPTAHPSRFHLRGVALALYGESGQVARCPYSRLIMFLSHCRGDFWPACGCTLGLSTQERLKRETAKTPTFSSMYGYTVHVKRFILELVSAKLKSWRGLTSLPPCGEEAVELRSNRTAEGGCPHTSIFANRHHTVRISSRLPSAFRAAAMPSMREVCWTLVRRLASCRCGF